VTSPSSTPNCSTMICFTLSSVAVAMCQAFLCAEYIRCNGNRSGVLLLRDLLFYHFRILLNVLDSVLHGLDALRLVVRDLQPKRLLDRHDQFHAVKRICAQVVHERSIRRDLALFHAELVDNDLLHLVVNTRHLGLPAEQISVLALRKSCKAR